MNPGFPLDAPRLRLARVDYHSGSDGRGEVEVALEQGGRQWVGRGDGLMTREGDMRMSADATLRAILASTDRRSADEPFQAELVGIKAVRAFDSWLVITSIEVDDHGRRLRLLGAGTAESGNLVRGAVLAVLDALNRILERHLR